MMRCYVVGVVYTQLVVDVVTLPPMNALGGMRSGMSPRQRMGLRLKMSMRLGQRMGHVLSMYQLG